jgi:Protein of unknown function (DUF3105)
VTSTAPRRAARRSPGPAQDRGPAPPPVAFAPRRVEFGPPPPPRYTPGEVVAIVGCALALTIGLVLLISGYFTSRDPSVVVGTAFRIGQSYPDQGNAVLEPGVLRPPYDSFPPTSGPHIPTAVTRELVQLSDDQLLSALAAGDIVVEYGSRRPPAGLRALATRLAGPFSPALAAAGQAVILARQPGTIGLVAAAWTRLVRVTAPGDALLREFIQSWLGRGAPG